MKVQHYSPNNSNTNSPKGTTSHNTKNIVESYTLELKNVEINLTSIRENNLAQYFKGEGYGNSILPLAIEEEKKSIANIAKVQPKAVKTYTEIKKLIEEGKLETIEKLSPEELNSRDLSTSETLLHVAAAQGNLQIVKLLYSKGLSLYAHNDEYLLPIHHAAAANQPSVIEWFLEQSKSLINDKGDYGFTPLHIAADNDAIETMICLIEKGADFKITDNGSRTPLDIFLTNNHDFCNNFSSYDWKSNDPEQILDILGSLESTLD